ncbi:MAG: hypothetical protein EOP86_27365 [Verrucomicrobiaceae bacterium]|nr:MAG: hypothetical protein EOP86_27365 [Verrucomicrobiaceae bacterium]
MLRAISVLVMRVQALTPEQREAVIGEFPESERANLHMGLTFITTLLTGSGSDAEFTSELEKPGFPGGEAMVLQKWASRNPAAALEYWKTAAARAEPPQWLREAAPQLFNQASQADPRLAVQAALSVSDEQLRRAALSQITLHSLYSGEKSSWPADGGQLISQLARAEPASLRRPLEYALNARLKQESPMESLAWIESLDLESGSRKIADRSLADAWKRQEPATAATWLLGRAAPGARAEVVSDIVNDWTLLSVSPDDRLNRPEPDLAACADWILSQGIGPDTQKGISRLADAWIEAGEPAAALAWAKAVPDPAQRGKTLDSISGQLRLRYPGTWQAMLRQADVPLGGQESLHK